MSWLLAFGGFAALIVLHELGHLLAAKAVGMRVERFSLFFPPLIWRRRFGETEYGIGAIPLGGYVKISGMNPSEDLPDEVRTRAYHAQPVWKRVVVIAAGPAMNLLIAFVLLFAFFWRIGPEEPTSRVGSVAAGFPAHGRIQPGDRLVAIDGRGGTVTELSKRIAGHRCPGAQRPGCRAATPATVTLVRAGRRVTFTMRPVYDRAAARTRIGFAYATRRAPEPLGHAARTSVSQFWFIAKATASLPARLFHARERREIRGVVGSYETTRQTIVNDLPSVVGLLAIISLSLAIVNLFPFLPLDGGHIFWAAVEKVRRRPVPYSTMERAGVVGFMLVIGLFFIGLSNDISRLTNEGFNVR